MSQSSPRSAWRLDGPGERDYVLAWTAIVFVPVGYLGAFLVGQGIAALFAGPGGTPAWIRAVAATLGTLVFLVPCAAAVLLGRRARRDGLGAGRWPMVVGGVMGAWFVATNLVSVLAGAV